MKEAVGGSTEASRKNSAPLDGVCTGLVVFGLFMFIPSFMFSLGTLIATRGRAWAYDPVRELFIVSVATFALLIALPLAARYGVAKNLKWARAAAVAAGVASSLVGALFLLSALSTGMAGGIFISALFLLLGTSVFWLLHRRRAV